MVNNDIQNWIEKLSKIELHVHLEGTISPQSCQNLAQKNNISIPPSIFDPSGHYYQYGPNLTDFLRVYDIVSSVLKNPDDYYFITYEYLKTIANDNARYAEMMLSPDHAALNHIDYPTLLDSCIKAAQKAKHDFGIECRFLINAIRHHGLSKCMDLLENIDNHAHPMVTGIGFAGDEANFPIKDFLPFFRALEQQNLQCSIHLGETCSTAEMGKALDIFDFKRIGHGVQAYCDTGIIKELAAREILLECCPSSNFYTHAFKEITKHPIKTFMEHGVPVCINTDDPPFFKTTLGKEYQLCHDFIGLNMQQILLCNQHAFDRAFMDDKTRHHLASHFAI